MSKRSRACDIPKRVKDKVWERDGHCCIICGSPEAMPNAHFIPRSRGGLGIAQNIVTLCINCHFAYDNGGKRRDYGAFIEGYLRSHYDDWDKEKLIYKKEY